MLWASCAEGNEDFVVLSWKYSWFSCFTKYVHCICWAVCSESTYQYYRRFGSLTFTLNNIHDNFENNQHGWYRTLKVLIWELKKMICLFLNLYFWTCISITSIFSFNYGHNFMINKDSLHKISIKLRLCAWFLNLQWLKMYLRS